MTRIIISLLMLTILSTSAAFHRPVSRVQPNAAFFFATNDTMVDALQSYAEMLCLADKASDASPEAVLAAGSECNDSRIDEDGDSLTRDGGWRRYVEEAQRGIVTMCVGNEAKVCEGFRQE